MEIIYKPKGEAHEYAKLGLNIYKGCTHRCVYCYNVKTPFVPADLFYQAANPKQDVIDRLTRDCARLSKQDDAPEILISFMGDPYQPAEVKLKLTRQVIRILIDYELPFTILTKGGLLATRDFDLLQGYPKVRFGTTLIFLNDMYSKFWEPQAPPWWERVKAIDLAHEKGIRTWVSIEPVIVPAQALLVIRELSCIVNHFKIGKLNHFPHIENDIDWPAFREEAVELLESCGADYYIKKCLLEA